MSWLWFVPILLVMVVIHEMGHFLTARLFKMKVHEFGIGFPPKVWSKKTKDGMEWSINALPIGGFVRIEGENGDSDDPNSFGSKPAWKRAIVLSAGPFMNLVLAFAIFLAVGLGGRDVPKGSVAIVGVVPNSPAAQSGMQAGDIIRYIGDKHVESTRDVSLETTLNKTEQLHFTLDRNGQTVNVNVKPRIHPPEGEGALGIEMGYLLTGKDIQAAAPEPQAGLNQGLELGDQITAVDGVPVTSNAFLRNYIDTASKDSVTLTIIRNGQQLTQSEPLHAFVDYIYKDSDAAKAGMPAGVEVKSVGLDGSTNFTPVTNTKEYNDFMQAHQGQKVQINYVNLNRDGSLAPGKAFVTANTSGNDRIPRVSTVSVVTRNLIVHETFGPASLVNNAFAQTWDAVTLIPRTFNALFNGSVPVNMVAGPVGMAQITGQAVDAGGLGVLLMLTALLSVNLGVMNILPIPALDGGRLVFVLIELVTRGRRVPPEKEGLVHFVGMMALLALMVLISFGDISRIITGGSFN